MPLPSVLAPRRPLGISQVHVGIRGPDQSELFRNGVKEICQSRGLLASFFSKPFGANGPGNGGHLNFSLWMPQPTSHGGCNSSGQVEEAFIPDGYRNAMVNCREEDTISGLSQLAEHFIAGVSPSHTCFTVMIHSLRFWLTAEASRLSAHRPKAVI